MISAPMMTTPRSTDRAVKVLETALLRDLGLDHGRSNLGQSMVSLEFAKREIIYAMGDASDGVYFVERGRVKVYRLSVDGREITLGILGPGDIFGEESLLRADPRETFSEALEPSTVFFVDAREFRRIASRSPALAMRLFEIAGTRLARTQQQVEDLAFRGVTRRIANLLIGMADDHGVTEGSEIVLTPRLTHQQMASLVGTTRETFTATLSKLSNSDLIRSNRRAVRILDLGALQALV